MAEMSLSFVKTKRQHSWLFQPLPFAFCLTALVVYLRKRYLGVLALIFCLWAGSAHANMPAPMWIDGDCAATPITTLTPAEIVQETLTIDLIPLKDGQPGTISATYQIRNPNPPTTADFLFISPGITNGKVTVNQTPVAAQPVLVEDVAPKFRDAVQRYTSSPALANAAYLQFRAMLPQGEFPIAVQYRVRPDIYEGFSPYRQYRIQYALAPAKDWQRFGKLDLAIQVPPGWQSTTTPALRRSGDRLSGSFQGIPADQLMIELQPGDGAQVAQRQNGLMIASLAIAGCLCAALGWHIGRLSKRGLVWCQRRGAYWLGFGWLGSAIALLALVPLCPLIFWLILSLTNVLGRLGLPARHVSSLWNPESGRIWGALIFGMGTAIVAVVLFAIAAATFKGTQETSRSSR
jgi:hypothetical protein